jgi:arsenate reductase (thioredoxin)
MLLQFSDLHDAGVIKSNMSSRILILCTGNSCRSQMAEGILRSLDEKLLVFSAGTQPAAHVSSEAISVMKEIDIDISSHTPKSVDQFLSQSFDYVITVCDHAKETCPFFTGNVVHRLHMGFDDPADATGTEEEVLAVFRQVRDQIKIQFHKFYADNLSKK